MAISKVTNKERVKNVFPHAKCFISDIHFAIMEIPETLWLQIKAGYVNGKLPIKYSKWFPSSEQAWDDAWKTIQKDFMDKLEE